MKGEFIPDPRILTQPNIPKALHGINPRSILGQEWWDDIRKKAYASTRYHCAACGVHKDNAKEKQWLEAHEYWVIDYNTGVCTVTHIVPLCHYCHNFIHSGRLMMLYQRGEINKRKALAVLEHGFDILEVEKLDAFPGTVDIARFLGARTFGVQPNEINFATHLHAEDFKLWFNGKYYSRYINE